MDILKSRTHTANIHCESARDLIFRQKTNSAQRDIEFYKIPRSGLLYTLAELRVL